MRSPCRTAPYVQDPGGTARICTLVATERARSSCARNEPRDSGPVCDADRDLRAPRPRTVTLLSAPRGLHVVPESPAAESSGPLLSPPLLSIMTVIAETLIAALPRRSPRRGSPSRRSSRSRRRRTGSTATSSRASRSGCRSRSARAAPRSRNASRARSRRRRLRTSSASRSRVPASSTSSSHRPGCTTCSRRSSRPVTRMEGVTPTRARVNLEFVSANPTGPLHAGGGRWVAVGDAIANLLAAQGAGRPPRVLPERRRQPARDLRRVALRPVRGTPLPEDGYQGAYLVEMAERLRAELGDDVTEEQAREWGLARRGRAAEGRPRAHRRALRHLVLRAHAARARARSARCSSSSPADGLTYEKDGATWLRAEDLGDQRDRVLVKSDGNTTYLAATTSRITATRSIGAGST